MATFSLGTSGVTPGAPGVYINEQAGLAANAAIAPFSTVYMLVETDEDVPVTQFPFNTPTPVTSLNDYKELIRVGTSTVPAGRIPLLSYNCVNEFFQNAQVGDLRVVRVGTPNQIAEIELFPLATKQNATSLPQALMAGDVVYMQVTINGIQVVAGDGSTGFTSNGEWLGVPVTIPVNYVAGDAVNNRKISAAMATALTEALESNPAVASAVYVRESGLVNTRDPASNSENGFVTIASTAFDGNVSVVTLVQPVGSNFVFMQNAYDVSNIVGQSTNLQRVPEDYTQCISTAFDGQQDQGYLITPTAYAQFDAAGRAQVGAAAAAHCASNSYKWMALADPGPFLVTDINEYENFTPHSAAADLVTNQEYLIDNAIYEWLGGDISYNRLSYQTEVFGESAETAVTESANLVAPATKVGLLDSGTYTVTSGTDGALGVFNITSSNFWPVTLPIQKVTLSNALTGNDFASVSIADGSGGTTATGVDLNGTEVYLIAPPRDLAVDSEYSQNYVLMAQTAAAANNIYNAVVLLGGSNFIAGNPLAGCIFTPTPTGDTCQVAYADPFWDLPVTINGQESNLIENISSANTGVNTLHLPATLQDATETYILNWVSRTFYDPSASISTYGGTVAAYTGAALFQVFNHGLQDGQRVFFTKPITTTVAGTTTNLVNATTKLVSYPYWVKVLTSDTFVLSTSLNNYANATYVLTGGGTISTDPSIIYTEVLARGLNTISSTALLTLPMVRGRKYEFDSSNIFNTATDAALAPGSGVGAQPGAAIYLNNTSLVLGEDQITPYGEDLTAPSLCGWLPSLNLVAPTVAPVAAISNAYCVPTVDQFFQSEAYFVPALDSIYLGDYDGTANSGTIGPAATLGITAGANTLAAGTYTGLTPAATSGTGTGITVTITVDGANTITSASVNNPGEGYVVGDTLTLSAADGGGTLNIATIDDANGSVAAVATPGNSAYGDRLATLGYVALGDTAAQMTTNAAQLAGGYFDVTTGGTAPNGDPVVIGDRIALTFDGSTYTWVVIPAATSGGDLTSVGSTAYGSQVGLTFQPEQAVPSSLWRFDAVTSTEIIDDALRGVGFNGVPQAQLIESGVDNVNALLDDSQRYFNPFGFIAYYGPWVENGSNVYIPPSPYVTGVAVRRYRAEGYQFPPAGVKFQLADAIGTQIPINSAQQNLLNPKGCNAIRSLPGYPDTAVFIWGGRTRVNEADAQQRLYQFVNTRVILNVVYGSLRTAFDSQIFNVIDGFGVVFNQIISVGNSILNQLYVQGALFGARPSDAFQVICDNRINTPEDIENGIVNAKIFVTPVPTLERIQIDLIRVAIGKMQEELDIQGLGSNNQ